MKRLAIIVAMLSSAVSQALASVPIYSMYVGSQTGRGEIPSEQLWPALYYRDSQGGIISPIFETVLPENPYPSIITGTVSATTDPDFDDFIDILANDTVDTLLHGSWSSAGPKWGGGGTPEPDLRGFVITQIVETIYVDQVSPGMDLNGNGIWTDWSMSGTYDFYGYPIPEPTTGLLVVVGFVILRRRGA